MVKKRQHIRCATKPENKSVKVSESKRVEGNIVEEVGEGESKRVRKAGSKRVGDQWIGHDQKTDQEHENVKLQCERKMEEEEKENERENRQEKKQDG